MASSNLPARLDRFFSDVAPTAWGDAVVVAHSGGADSTALLAALLALAPRRGLRVFAAHLDHAIVPGSETRARAARDLARSLGAEVVVERRPVPELAEPGESPEAAARRVRYRFLEEVRSARGARWIATAHHRDDQAETVVLRMLQGTGLEGLAGIQTRRGRFVVRPVLDLPGDALRSFLEAALPPGSPGALEAVIVEDPSNQDLSIPRNRVRRLLLPRLEAEEPEVAVRLARLAEAAGRARRSVEGRLEAALAIEAGAGAGGAAGLDGARLRLDAFRALPAPLPVFALALLHRRACAPHPPGRAASAELLRQLAGGGGRLGGRPGAEAGVDAGAGWRWATAGGLLELLAPGSGAVPAERTVRPFSYRLPVPDPGERSELWIEETGATVRLRRAPIAPWMFRGSRHRAALAIPDARLGALVVRSRRAGDRIRPLGAPGERKLKDVLIDRRVPRSERDRLPLVVVDGRIAWVPGVTIDDVFRLPERLRHAGGETWILELRDPGARPRR